MNRHLWWAAVVTAALFPASLAAGTYQFQGTPTISINGESDPGFIDLGGYNCNPTCPPGSYSVDILNNGTEQHGWITATAPAAATGTPLTADAVLLDPVTFTVTTSGLSGLTVQVSTRSGSSVISPCSGGAAGFSCTLTGIRAIGTDPNYAVGLGLRIQITAPSGNTTATVTFDLTWTWQITGSGGGSFKIDHVEAVQTIQNATNSLLPLIAGKTTLVRAFVTSNSAKPVYPIRGTMNGQGNTWLIADSSEVAAPPPPPNRGAQALDFFLYNPPAGVMKLSTDATQWSLFNFGSAPKPEETEHNDTSVTFVTPKQAPKDFYIGYLLFCIGPAVGQGPPRCPSSKYLDQASAVADAAFPFPEGTFQYLPIPLDPIVLTYTTSFPEFDIRLSRTVFKYYLLLNVYPLGNLLPRIDHLTAFIPRIGRGPADYDVTIDVPKGYFADYELLAQTLKAPTQISWGRGDDRDFEATPNFLAHRLGHQFGLIDHISGIDDVGWDGQFKILYGGEENLMTPGGAGDVRTTFTAADFKTLMDTPAPVIAAAAEQPQGIVNPKAVHPDAVGAGDYVLVSGIVQRNGSGAQIDPVYHVSTSRPQPPSDPGGNHCLVFSNGANVLGQYCFTLDVTPTGVAGLDQQIFAVTAPWPAGTTNLALVRGGSTLATLSAAAQDPVVTILSPKAGGQLTGMGTISWSVTGAAGPVVSTVLYSPDGGNSWLPMATDITDTHYIFNTSNILGGPQVYLRVIAASGLNSSSATIGPINVPQTPKIGASLPALDFGNVTLGQVASQTVAITNTGTGPLTVTSVSVDNPAFSIASKPAGPLRAGAQFAITVNLSAPSVGAETGTLTIQSSDPATPPLAIPLTGAAFATPAPSIGVIQTPIDFGNVPVGQTGEMPLPVINSGTSLDVTSISSSNPQFVVGGPAAPLTVASGEQDVTLRFTPNGTGLKTATVTVASNDPTHPSLTVQVQGTGIHANGAVPVIGTGGVVDAASFQHVLVPGGLATIFGLNFTAGSTTGAASSLPLPTILAGVSVTVAGKPAPLIFVNAVQINFQVPFEVVAGTSAPVVVTANGVSSASVVAPVATYAVGVFTYARTATAIDPVVRHAATNELVTPSNPAKAGEALVVYATGVGNLVNRPLTGFGAPSQPLAMAVDTPQVTLGGAAVQVLFAGLTPGFVGLVQINLQLPASLPAGASLPLVFQFPNSNPSVPVNLSVAGTPGASITVSPSTLDFGSVDVGQSKDLTLTVNNTGGAGVNVTVTSSNAQFTANPANAFPVGANSSAQVTVHFAPTATGLQSATLTISTGGATQSIPVTVSGTGTAGTGANVIRTLVYNEITRFTKEVRFSNGGMPVLSSSGNRIVYANAPGDETDARYNDIFVINADGSGQHEVDSYKQNCDCIAIVDISADGNAVVSTDGMELRIASATGSAGNQLITNREIPYIRISPTGDKVFFINRRGDASLSDATTERGLYVINADGSGLRQVAGPSAVATLLGLTADKVFPFATNGWSLDVSSDGTKIVFGVLTPNGEQILDVNADGTGLRQVLGPVDFVNHVALSGDGSKVAYDVAPPPCCSTPNEVGVVNFDGSNRKALATNTGDFGSNHRMELNGDGSELLYGSSSYLYATDGSGVLQLSALGGSFSSDTAPLVGEGLFLPTMNTNASRFVYISKDDAGIPQLATLDINPTALGGAPAITSPALTQALIGLNGSNPSLVTAKVTTSNQVSRVSAAVLNSGITDPNVSGPVMVDDGTNGDQVAGDGIYTGTISANCCAVLGPKNVRVKAEVRDSGGVRHATAIEFGGLSVGATAASRH